MARTISVRADILTPKRETAARRAVSAGRRNNLAHGKVVDERTSAYHSDMDFNLDEAIAVLERTPAVLLALLDELPEDWTRVDEGPDTWTPREVVAHLIHGERTDWIPRARIILKQETYRRFDPFDRFAVLKSDRPLRDLLGEFDQLRSGNVATLRGWNLKEKDMELTGEHPEFGPVTLRQLLATWVAHDLGHVAQTARVMAKQYRDAIGPWRAYLPIMDR